jgi:hypothetical protein
MNELTRQDRLDDLEKKQAEVIELLTWFRDNYSDRSQYGLLLNNFKGASDQIHKIRVAIAEGEEVEV